MPGVPTGIVTAKSGMGKWRTSGRSPDGSSVKQVKVKGGVMCRAAMA